MHNGFYSLFIYIGYSQNKVADYAKLINTDTLKSNLEFLSSDLLEGRASGQTGQKLASHYIANKLQDYRVKPSNGNSYFQEFMLLEESWENITFKVGNKGYEMNKDFFAYNYAGFSKQINANNILFLGYGIDENNYSDYKDIDVQNKVILIFNGEPMDTNGNYFVTGTHEPSKYSLNWQEKVKIAKNKGAKAVLIYGNKLDFNEDKPFYIKPYIQSFNDLQDNPYINTFFLSPQMADHILYSSRKIATILKSQISKAKHSVPITLFTSVHIDTKENTKFLTTENVLGFIEGNPKNNKTIVITAHLDHLGVKPDGIYNGADDNASGCASILEIARLFQKAKEKGNGPKVNLLFLFVTGEEIGLLGSKYFTAHPTIPLDNILLNINLDMVGRIDELHEKETPYIYVMSTDKMGTHFKEVNHQVNQITTQLKIDYKYNNETHPAKFFQRSDQYSFIEKGIPALVFFSGLHKDYHKPEDTFNKIEWELLNKRTQLIFNTIWTIANE